ncbi:hypothetical protein SPSIL_044220 [Sporomusa silvacetica DSM 10669]|uniref:Uncharacterized protein n=1 Tax=Sporomusa silvacetica DSM 10669 TaxID=1123289 RepID=A0ABZ3IRZ0_9FIRM|nr:hypothetical protein SPSIL_15510 [Sporomusa silvacetica DSM 10669]
MFLVVGCALKRTGQNKEISNTFVQGWKDIFK